MNALPSILLLTSLGLTSLHAGDWAQDLTTTPDAGTPEIRQNVFGAPVLKFGRDAAGSMLPGYTVGTVAYRHQFESDFDSLPGEVSSDQITAGIPILPLNFGSTHIIAGLLYEGTKFNTTGTTMLTEDSLHDISLPVVFLNDHSEKWIWGGMVMPSFSGDLSSSENFAISAAAGVGYAFSPTLTLAGGVYYSHGIDDDNFVIPGVVFTWRPNDRIEVFFFGITGGISYAINEDLIVSLFGEYDPAEWHVEADEYGPDRNIEVDTFSVGLKLERRISELFWIRASGGYSFAREMTIENLKGSKIQESDIDGGPFVQAGLNLRF